MSASKDEIRADAVEGFHGLIQHSFALRIPVDMRPQYSREDVTDTTALLRALYEPPAAGDERSGFRLMPVGRMAGDSAKGSGGGRTPGDHSLLVRRQQTTIRAQTLPFIEREEIKGTPKYTYPLPDAFAWTTNSEPNLQDPERSWDGFVFAEEDGASGEQRRNDFLIAHNESPPQASDARAVSWLLCQLLAHRRSRLFGPSLARRIFNVLLPHALLDSGKLSNGDRCVSGAPGGDPCRSEG